MKLQNPQGCGGQRPVPALRALGDAQAGGHEELRALFGIRQCLGLWNGHGQAGWDKCCGNTTKFRAWRNKTHTDPQEPAFSVISYLLPFALPLILGAPQDKEPLTANLIHSNLYLNEDSPISEAELSVC